MGEYLLVGVHRQENVYLPEKHERVLACLVAVRNEWGLPLLVSTRPRARKKLEALGVSEIDGIDFHEPFGHLDYNHLQMNAKCVISDSGTISEESAIIGFPAVLFRNSMERPESLDAGTLVLGSLSPENLRLAVNPANNGKMQTSDVEGYSTVSFSEVCLRFVVSTAPQRRIRVGIR